MGREAQVLLWLSICLVHSWALQDKSDGDAAMCTAVSNKISEAEFVLDAQALQIVDGDVQKVLDCVPEGTKVLVDLDVIPAKGNLIIRKPIGIHPGANRKGMKVSEGGFEIISDGITIDGLIMKDCKRWSDSAFLHIEAANNVVIKDVECSGCSNLMGPGCISSIDSTVFFDNISAVGNKGQKGGAMGFTDSTIVIKNSRFEGNDAYAGGALSFNDCVFNISDTEFFENTASGRGGGVHSTYISREVDTPSHIKTCKFLRNRSKTSDGGGAYIMGKANIQVAHTDVRENDAVGGGGMFFDYLHSEGGTIKIDSSTISRNTANFHGGGLAFRFVYSKTGEVSIKDSKIEDNAVINRRGYTSLGGYANDRTESLEASISSNSLYEGGGGAYFDFTYSGKSTIHVDNTIIARNKVDVASGGGGGIFFDHQDAIHSNIKVSKSTIDGNSAPIGEAVYFNLKLSITTNILLLGSSIENNYGAPNEDAGIDSNEIGAIGIQFDDTGTNYANNSAPQVGTDFFINGKEQYRGMRLGTKLFLPGVKKDYNGEDLDVSNAHSIA